MELQGLHMWKNKLEDFSKDFDLLVQEVEKLVNKETLLEGRKQSLDEIVISIDNKEKNLKEKESKLMAFFAESLRKTESMVKEAEIKSKRMQDFEKEYNEKQNKLALEMKEIEEKRAEVEEIAKKAEAVKQILEQALKVQFLTDKEKKIDRERKEILDKREENILQREERLQRLATL